MTVVTYASPVYRLASILRRPGGKSVAAAVKDAGKNLETLVPPCLDSIDRSLAIIDHQLETLLCAQDPEPILQALYKTAEPMIGIAATAGLRDFDRAIYSLCDLIDGMLTRGICDREAVRVHVKSLHLLRSLEGPQASQAILAILAGLQRVREKVLGTFQRRAEPTDVE